MIVIGEFISIRRDKGGLSLEQSWRAGGRALNVFKLDKNKLFQLCFVTFASHHTLKKKQTKKTVDVHDPLKH